MKENNKYKHSTWKWITDNQGQYKRISIVGKSLDKDVNARHALTKCRETCGNFRTGL